MKDHKYCISDITAIILSYHIILEHWHRPRAIQPGEAVVLPSHTATWWYHLTLVVGDCLFCSNCQVWFGLLGFNASATGRVISRR